VKKRVLFVYYTMLIGGSTTSLLSLLEHIDFNEFDVDLLLYRNEGPLLEYIPEKVNLLPQAYIPQSKTKKIMKTMLNGTLPKAYWHGYKYTGKWKQMLQSMAYAQMTLCRKLPETYDVAIGFMELWSDVYVNQCVNAKKKISWVHVDFEKAHFIPAIDRKMFSKSDVIVNVAEECNSNFIEGFPELKDRCRVIENILTRSFLQKRSEAERIKIVLDHRYLNLLSVCRLVIDHKGLDRGVKVIRKLKDKGYRIRWYLIGEGKDRAELQSMISDYDLRDDIILLGASTNPYTVFKEFDAFFLPSRFEGKPMAVTEAQMLMLPPVVAEYASARSQIVSGETGITAENSEEGIFRTLDEVCRDQSVLKKIRMNLVKQNFDNEQEIRKIMDLLRT